MRYKDGLAPIVNVLFKKNIVCRVVLRSCGYTGTAICRKNAWDSSFCAKKAQHRRWKRLRLIFRNVKLWSTPKEARPETEPSSTYQNMCSRIFSHRLISPALPSLRTARLRRSRTGKRLLYPTVSARTRIWWYPRTTENVAQAKPYCQRARNAVRLLRRRR